tara:strand:- start:198 stop:488 length:291 start_codon:yes stop_codon:yes gene_type:complete
MNKTELLDLFREFFPQIGGKNTGGWKFKIERGAQKGFSVQCRNGTKNYIIPDSCKEVLEKWNKDNPHFQLCEVEKYCIEDDEVWTWIIWAIDFDKD